MASSSSKGLKIFVAGLFLVVLPLLAVLFSKWGLDTYRSIRSEMAFLKDSIEVLPLQLKTHRQQPFDTADTKGRMFLAHFAPTLQSPDPQLVISRLQPIQRQFNREDLRKYWILTYTMDSAAVAEQQIRSHSLDSLNWKFILLDSTQFAQAQQAYRMPNAQTIALVNSKGYLCDLYAASDTAAIERLKTHMAIVVPKKERKRYKYRPEEDPYQ